ncbi:MAG: hypothetical protein JWM04_1980, partial [Verrucomicrobiales bacterium]|nr:hypothetical protein [Verrucomicrobiales bacterium]
MHFVDVRLGCGEDQRFGDADVRRTTRNPDHGVGHVPGGKRGHAVVGFFRAGGVSLETDGGKFGFCETGVQGGDANASSVKFEAKSAGDAQFGRFGATISRSVFLSHMASDRSDVEYGGAGIFAEQGNDTPRHSQEPND